MNKYILYRIGIVEEDDEDRDEVEAEEMVAVEFGDTIDDVLENLLRAVRDDLSEMPEYAQCEVNAYGPHSENCSGNTYDMMGVVCPPAAEKNILIDYIVEEEEA